MERTTIIERLLKQAYLFDDPRAYRAGVEDAVAALEAAEWTPGAAEWTPGAAEGTPGEVADVALLEGVGTRERQPA